MKYPYIICLILFLIIGSVNGSAQFVIHHSNFENNYSFISYSPQLNNVWQVGPTIKPFFGSSNSLPNAIMTDTINPYPINITSSFIIRLHQDVNYPPEVPNFIWLDFDHKYQTSDGYDGGSVEVSYDSINWQNILLDTLFANNSECTLGQAPSVNNFYSVSDTLYNGQPGFSNQSNGWIHSSAFWCWYLPVSSFVNQIPPDSMWIRFTFYSDSISESKDGWIIDNVVLSGDNPSGINDPNSSKTSLKIFPQPAIESFSIQLFNNEIPKEYAIFCIDGREIAYGNVNLNLSIPVNELKSGYYLLKVLTKSGHVYFHSLVIE